MEESDSAGSLLVVDDTVENLRLLASMLGEHGYEVRPVTDGRLALQAATSDPPDLILLDINMPGMDGYEVCARLREVDALKEVPVIFLTALSETRSKIRAFALGGADYITKPFDVEEVLARVRVHVGLRRARVELERNYERLRALERLRDDLVHMVVHDMRSPLTALIGNLELLQYDARRALGEQNVEELVDAIRAASAVNQMANDLLDVSRLEEKKLPLTREPHDLAGIAHAVGADFAGWNRTRVIDVRAAGPVTCTCDGRIIRRVLENLVGNAVKHTPSGSRVEIAIAPRRNGVRASVCDEGAGIPAAARATIFEKFGTVSARQERTYHSSGLGLAFCKLAVEAHGGSIGVDPREPRGSVFWFELPV